MLQESNCWLLRKAFAPQAEILFVVSVFPVPAAASFPSGILSPLSCPRSHPLTFGGNSQAGNSSVPHQLFLSSFRNTFYSGKDVPEGKTTELEPTWPRGWFLRGLGEPRPRSRAVAPSREVSSPSQRAELLQGSFSACQLCSIPRASHSLLTAFNYL